MMIESDVIYAYVKSSDWLKPAANKLMTKITRGEFGTVYSSREILHELYYVSLEEGVSLEEFIRRAATITAIPNLTLLPTVYEIDLLALALMQQYKLSSIFDAYYAATCLKMVEDKTIITTDEEYDKVAGIKRIDPRDI
ncbi:MAG: type II toxin-antitoxin system VapC family toxin [Candidatus Caldarchaeum sp.]|jgi:predicted nucleic acid-binding protein|uniref:PIN domain-containing protein n=1 Tax=Caldiarchaeum subterraneum TaxID=311458 RepID=A0A7C4I6C2_CALS0|nr:type II toxin-antitoxin system VapC family toxin [Candidatus Caldarchaeales archaeon]MDJ0272080.1 type II toxin-antitoxin system VapC family toxin [Candidatus Caldarchaeales archaeon]